MIQLQSAILWDVVEEHLDEASFLWRRREQSLDSPLYTFAQACKREEARFLAHVDGLLAGGTEVAEKLLEPALESKERDRVAAAAFALLAGGGRDRVAALFRRAEKAAVLDGLGRALETSPRADIRGVLLETVADRELSAEVRARALQAIAFRREDAGDALKSCFTDPDPGVRAAAVRAARGPEGRRYRNYVLRALSAAEPEVGSAAMTTGLALGMRAAWEECVQDGGALLYLALLGGEQERALLLDAMQRPEQLRGAIFAAGFSGWKAAAEACLPWIMDAELGPLAGEAFCGITGLRASDYLLDPALAEAPESLPALEEDELDAELVPPSEAALPALDFDKVRHWWESERRNFAPNVRYLEGRPFAKALHATLETTSTRRRRVLAFVMPVYSGGRLDVETQALEPIQRRQISGFGELSADQLARAIGSVVG